MRKVCKRFGYIKALDNVDLDICPGRIIGLVGANGSGKSTLLRHIIGLYLADEGDCVTFGCEAGRLGASQLSRIGYVHQEGELLDWMKVRQLIRYISDFDISLKARVGSLSPGQRQKLAILLAMGFEPEFLILDEPASALDPIARAQFLDLLLGIIQDSTRTIIISSHILSDVEKVIDHLLIMKEGHLLRDCSFDELREEFCRLKVTSLDGQLPAELPFAEIVDCIREEGRAVLVLRNYSQEKLEAQAQMLNCEIETETLSLEEIYRIVVSE
jgi:ABC-2 type transport system ATP-binding protein